MQTSMKSQPDRFQRANRTSVGQELFPSFCSCSHLAPGVTPTRGLAFVCVSVVVQVQFWWHSFFATVAVTGLKTCVAAQEREKRGKALVSQGSSPISLVQWGGPVRSSFVDELLFCVCFQEHGSPQPASSTQSSARFDQVRAPPCEGICKQLWNHLGWIRVHIAARAQMGKSCEMEKMMRFLKETEMFEKI